MLLGAAYSGSFGLMGLIRLMGWCDEHETRKILQPKIVSHWLKTTEVNNLLSTTNINSPVFYLQLMHQRSCDTLCSPLRWRRQRFSSLQVWMGRCHGKGWWDELSKWFALYTTHMKNTKQEEQFFFDFSYEKIQISYEKRQMALRLKNTTPCPESCPGSVCQVITVSSYHA